MVSCSLLSSCGVERALPWGIDGQTTLRDPRMERSESIDLVDFREVDRQLAKWGKKLRKGVAASHSAQELAFVEEEMCNSGGSVPSSALSSFRQLEMPRCKTWPDMAITWPASPLKSRSCEQISLDALRGAWIDAETMKKWFRLGSSSQDLSLKSTEAGELEGTVVLHGSLEDQCLAALETVLVEALVEALAPVAGLGSSSARKNSEKACDDSGLEPCSVRLSQSSCLSKARAVFFFKVILGDPNDLPAALEVLRLEGQLAGSKRLLPRLVRCLGEMVGRLSLSLDVIPPSWL